MPWLGEYTPKSPATRQWQTVIKNALHRRVNADELRPPLKELQSQHRVLPDELATILLDFRSRNVGTDDPLLFHYAGLFIRMRLTGTSNLLSALLNTSRFTKRPDADNAEPNNTGLLTCEERMFILLTQLHMTDQVPTTALETHGRVFILTRWMHAVTEYEMGKQLEGGALHSADAFAYGLYDALASLVLTIFGHADFKLVGKQTWWKKRRAMIVDEMGNFDSHVLQWMQSQLGGRLRGLASLPPFLETDSRGFPILSDQQIMHSISDLPVVNTRAGLFIWLNACLSARPLTDDMSVLAYLQARYSGANQTLVVDLLVACFDVLTNALLRKESDQSVKVVRSFICNKVPMLLSMLAGFMPPMTVESAIQMAFMTISMDAKTPLSEGAVEARNKLKLTRTEFLQASYLHGLITETTVTEIVAESPVTLPKNKYSKEMLLAQCSSNINRIESLVSEIEGTAGNANAIASCIVETLSNLCMAKDTMSLKTACNVLIKRIPALDIILQYTSPVVLLLPLCNILNDWVHDQDQAELTPSYEEFASILLFIFAAVHRYDLKRADLGLPNDGNFVAKLLHEKAESRPLSQLTDEQNSQLAKWIEGLYGTDEHGESSGISDEVMRQCPPQSFFALVPTLFEQSVLACKFGNLQMKIFKGGLELLVEPFLLPSLVGGLSWLVQHSWEDHGDGDILLQILDKLLKPSSSSSDTKAMHKAILAIVAAPLYSSLQDLSKKKPEKKEVAGLMDVLRPHLNSQRTMHCSQADMMAWASTPDGGIAKSIQNAICDHIVWVSTVGPTPPPKYTHLLFACGTKILGAGAVLDAIVATLKNETNNGNGAVALDVCTAMVAAPSPSMQPAMMAMGAPQQQSVSSEFSVRDALRLRTLEAQSLLLLPVGDSEALVRLHRRVEAQLTVNAVPQLPMAMGMADPAADQIMADLGLADHAVGTAALGTSLASGAPGDNGFGGGDLNGALGASMDLDAVVAQNIVGVPPGSAANDNMFDDLDLNLGSAGQQMQNADGTGNAQDLDEDIFAGLDMTGVDDDFNFS